jgi:hypothetical protein
MMPQVAEWRSSFPGTPMAGRFASPMGRPSSGKAGSAWTKESILLNRQCILLPWRWGADPEAVMIDIVPAK